ncbi:uncharacterized protein [Nicotiana sylvestris]|uniref:uncharacterized protein n=1 Tax=Nicotiana sylvestris TaxID=4096 RepID=UPI00388C4A9E
MLWSLFFANARFTSIGVFATLNPKYLNVSKQVILEEVNTLGKINISAPLGNWEGQSTARPPLFNGQYYSWWKNRMRDHIIREDYEHWDIVTDGPLETTKKTSEGLEVPKTRADYTAEDLKKWEKNVKANKWLVCGLGLDEYSRIQSCNTTKEIWDTLQVAHEGTPQVKRSRGTLLYSQYENFTMKEGETIQEMYTRFTTLTNELKSLGRIIFKEDKVEKILTRVLPVAWESKITAIQKSKNTATLKLDELIGNLTAYELRRQTKKIDAPKKERSLALRISEGSDLEDDEIAMITRDFKKYLMRGKGSSRGTTFNKPRALEKQTNEGCFKCGKTNHMIKNYPQWEIEWKKERVERRNRKKEQVQPRRNKGTTKVMVDAWGETSDEDSEDEAEDEQALMAIGESDDEQEVQVKGRSQIWYMDSDYSKHMTGNKDQLGHASLNQLNKLVSKDFVIGLTNIKFKEDKVCEACASGKQSDYGTEYENAKFAEYCDENGVDHNFSAPRTPQQNGVVERKNRTLEDMARSMLLSSKLPHIFWAEAEYDDEAIGLVKELTESPAQVNVASKEGTGDGTGPSTQGNLTGGNNQGEIESNSLKEHVHEHVPQQQNKGETSSRNQLIVKSHKYQSSHPIENIITDPTSGVKTRSQLKNMCAFDAFLSLVEPKNVVEALQDVDWVNAMNKLDEDGIVTRNKTRLVVQGYSQEVGIDYHDTFAPVARLEAIRLHIAIAAHMEFTLHQIDAKSAFLNGYLKE